MSRYSKPNPNLRWFEQYPNCPCGKPARGVLRGVRNESYGFRCKPCADRELKAAEKARGADMGERV